MLRLAVFAGSIAALTVVAAGIVDASPLVFWSTHRERAAIEHGRTVVLIGTALTLLAAAAIAGRGARRAALVVAVSPVVPAMLVVTASGTALGLLAELPALSVGMAAAFVGCTDVADRPRRAAGAAIGIGTLWMSGAGGTDWAMVLAAGLALAVYLHARAGGTAPQVAAVALVPVLGFAALTGIAVFAGGTLAG